MSKPSNKPPQLPTRLELLKQLPTIRYERSEKTDREQFEQVHLAGSLLLLAELSPEKEAALASNVAQHLLGHTPEPDDADLAE